MKDKRQTAYHEAGHAVITHRFDLLGGTATIISDPVKGYGGSCRCEGECCNGSTDEESIIIDFAGFAAEQLINPEADPRGSENDEEHTELLLRLRPPEDGPRLKAEAARMVRENREAIKTLAELLLEERTIPGDEWALVIEALDEGQDWRKYLADLRVLKTHRNEVQDVGRQT